MTINGAILHVESLGRIHYSPELAFRIADQRYIDGLIFPPLMADLALTPVYPPRTLYSLLFCTASILFISPEPSVGHELQPLSEAMRCEGFGSSDRLGPLPTVSAHLTPSMIVEYCSRHLASNRHT